MFSHWDSNKKVRFISDIRSRNIKIISGYRVFSIIFTFLSISKPYMSIKMLFFQQYGGYGDFKTIAVQVIILQIGCFYRPK